MSKYTIITTTGTLTIRGKYWVRGPDAGVFVYGDPEDEDPIAEIDAAEFIAIYEDRAGDYTAAADTITTDS